MFDGKNVLDIGGSYGVRYAIVEEWFKFIIKINKYNHFSYFTFFLLELHFSVMGISLNVGPYSYSNNFLASSPYALATADYRIPGDY